MFRSQASSWPRSANLGRTWAEARLSQQLLGNCVATRGQLLSSPGSQGVTFRGVWRASVPQLWGNFSLSAISGLDKDDDVTGLHRAYLCHRSAPARFSTRPHSGLSETRPSIAQAAQGQRMSSAGSTPAPYEQRPRNARTSRQRHTSGAGVARLDTPNDYKRSRNVPAAGNLLNASAMSDQAFATMALSPRTHGG